MGGHTESQHDEKKQDIVNSAVPWSICQTSASQTLSRRHCFWINTKVYDCEQTNRLTNSRNEYKAIPLIPTSDPTSGRATKLGVQIPLGSTFAVDFWKNHNVIIYNHNVIIYTCVTSGRATKVRVQIPLGSTFAVDFPKNHNVIIYTCVSIL
jgi:hypothetical protein